MKTKGALIGLLGLAVIVVLALLWRPDTAPTRSPDITLTTLQGDSLSLAALRGQPVLVNFWASTCATCIRELPRLAELHREFAPFGLNIIGIAMAYDPPDRVIAFSRARNIPYAIALDIQGRAAQAFGDVQFTPSFFLIAPDGSVALRESGELDIQSARAMIQAMLPQASIPLRQLIARD